MYCYIMSIICRVVCLAVVLNLCVFSCLTFSTPVDPGPQGPPARPFTPVVPSFKQSPRGFFLFFYRQLDKDGRRVQDTSVEESTSSMSPSGSPVAGHTESLEIHRPAGPQVHRTDSGPGVNVCVFHFSFLVEAVSERNKVLALWIFVCFKVFCFCLCFLIDGC